MSVKAKRRFCWIGGASCYICSVVALFNADMTNAAFFAMLGMLSWLMADEMI